MRRLRVFWPAVGLMILAACAAPRPRHTPAPEVVFVLIPDAGGKTGQIVVTNSAGKQTLTIPGTVVSVASAQSPPRRQRPLAPPQVRAVFKAALQSRPMSSVHYILYFKYGISELTDSSRKRLPQVARRILEAADMCRGCDILVVGHADTKGAGPYNISLGLARAKTVADRLAALGIPPERMDIVSHGEKNLFIPTPDDVAEPRNRRVTIIVR